MKRRDALQALALAPLAVAPFATSLRARASTTPATPATRRTSSGLALPVVGLGTWRTFDVGPTREQRAGVAEVLRTFAALGGRVVDTAPSYGAAESVLGDLTRELGLAHGAGARDEGALFVATKVAAMGRKDGKAQLEASMRALRTERLDLVQIHNLYDLDRQLDLVRGYKQDGRVRFVGVSHVSASGHDDLARAIRRGVDFVQVNYNAAEREAEKRVLPAALDHGVAVLANRPFAGGDLVRLVANKPLPDVAKDLGVATWAELLLKLVLAHPAVTATIPATSNVAHLVENMRASTGALPDELQRARIARAALG